MLVMQVKKILPNHGRDFISYFGSFFAWVEEYFSETVPRGWVGVCDAGEGSCAFGDL